MSSKTIDQVKEYYGEVLSNSDDLKTSACCPIDAMSPRIQAILKEVEPEILERFYGCGSPIPEALEGATVLDLGCGTGRDVYVLSKLVGPKGHVIGVDMTDEQLDVARKYLDKQTERFGYDTPNVTLLKGYIEDLASLDIKDNSIDLVVSNCVLNLSPDKEKVFSEIFRVLKPGGELYFSDVFADRRVPQHLQEDLVLRGECLSGALYHHDFRRLLQRLGCADYRIVSQGTIDLIDPEVIHKIGMINFSSVTVRAFKLDDLEDVCEDYGQVAIYQGTMKECPHTFALDDHHLFETHKPMLVCGNTASMLENTRYSKHFRVVGDRTVHLGEFDCFTPPASAQGEAPSDDACCTPSSSGGCC
ncbi:MAG TPA: methyltransferase type 11 [Myxococcales bacterium]|nr:methyltransferase type 11 [Deltaproteobacteria bacterium]MBU53882.1 methyltransferase type 11 [Deltaproteobacteria bacterium]HAA56070.1 methyltransferase type 11 [Myxococcales bacterium]